MKREINHDLSARKWAITESILAVALERRVSTQLVRAEILHQLKISPSLLSLLEKTAKSDKKNTLTIVVEHRLNTYFSQHLQKKVYLNGTLEFVPQR